MFVLGEKKGGGGEILHIGNMEGIVDHVGTVLGGIQGGIPKSYLTHNHTVWILFEMVFII